MRVIPPVKLSYGIPATGPSAGTRKASVLYLNLHRDPIYVVMLLPFNPPPRAFRSAWSHWPVLH